MVTRIIGAILMLFLFIFVAFSCNLAAAEPSDYDILKKADEARGNLEGVAWEVSVIEQEHNLTNYITYSVKARGFDILASTLAPPKHKDDKVLMVNGNMWYYKPGLSKPVPISQRQKLMGNAAYGDITATNYAEDYEANRLPDEMIAGELCYVFDLKAKSKECTYDRIRYWVSKDRLVGVKADYYTLSGKRFKSSLMDYTNKVIYEGEEKPFISRVGIVDVLMSNDATVLKFDKPNIQPVADYVFNLNLLQK
jgi:negative regulator of sigma E activity